MTESITTAALELAYEVSGPGDGRPLLAVHGWPDDPRTWDGALEGLHDAGHRVYRPYLRGYGPTRFADDSTPRIGQEGVLVRDLEELIEALGLDRPILVGHDWGGRAGYGLAALRPDLISGLVAISVGYEASGPSSTVAPRQGKAYWYQWYLTTAVGRKALVEDRRGLCHFLWRTWAPSWSFEEEEFERTAASWDNPDWPSVTIHSYAQRWGEAEGDPGLAELEARLAETPPIDVPTVVLHGEEDGASLVGSSEGQEELFTAAYERRVLPGVGHFVPREAPEAVVAAVRGVVGDGG